MLTISLYHNSSGKPSFIYGHDMKGLSFIICPGIDRKISVIELAGIDAAFASIAVHLESVPFSDAFFDLVP